MLTTGDLAVMRGVSERAIQKNKSLEQFIVGQSNCTKHGGHPTKIYSDDVLKYFNIDIPIMTERQRMSARSERSDIGHGRKLDSKYELDLINKIKIRYLSQCQINNLRRCVNEEIKILEEIPAGFDLDSFSDYIYFKRIARKDKNGEGVGVRDNWRLLHQESWNKIEMNNKTAKLRWENLELWHNLGLIGEGFGAGTFWVIDGTQLDAWVKNEDGKPCLRSYLHVLDGITRFPMAFVPLEKGETIEECMRIVSGCIQIYGLPRYGFMLDNGRAFASAAFRTFLEKMYSPELMRVFSSDWHKTMFYGSESPVKYPLAKLPSHNMKACIESAFKEYNRCSAVALPECYTGQAKTNLVRYENGSMPSFQLKNAADFLDAWSRFLNEIYTNFVSNRSPELNFATSKLGAKNTRADVFKFMGGIFEEKPFNFGLKNRIEPQTQHLQEYSYYLSEKEQRHLVKCGLGQACVIHEGQQRNYLSTDLSIEFYDRKITVIIDNSDPKDAYLFDVFDENRYSPFVSKDNRFVISGRPAAELSELSKT